MLNENNTDLLSRLMRRSNKPGNLTSELGLVVTEITEGAAKGTVVMKDDSVNPRGIVHGGALFAVMDQVAGLAACTTGYGTVTINGKIDYLRPANPGERLSCTATVLKPGRRFTTCEAVIENEDRKLLAKASFTYCMMEALGAGLKKTGD